MINLKRYLIGKMLCLAIFTPLILTTDLIALDHEAKWDFQDVEIGSSSNAAVSIANPGGTQVNLRISLSGDSDFVALSNLTNLISVLPQETITIDISFTPTTIGERSANIIITDGTPSFFSTIKLTGKGIRKNNQVSISEIIEFYDSAVFTGKLTGSDKKKVQLSNDQLTTYSSSVESKNAIDLNENRLKTFRNMLASAEKIIEDANDNLVCDKLSGIYSKTDGQNPPQSPPDFIFGEAKQDLANMISTLMQQIECY